MTNSIALTPTLPRFRTALIAPRGPTLVRNRRWLETCRCSVVGERRIQIALRASDSGLYALPGLARPIAPVRNRRTRVGRRRYRHQRQQEANLKKQLL